MARYVGNNQFLRRVPSARDPPTEEVHGCPRCYTNITPVEWHQPRPFRRLVVSSQADARQSDASGDNLTGAPDGWVNYLTRARLPAPPAQQLMDHHSPAC